MSLADQAKKLDPRDCPKCGARMEMKLPLDLFSLWQCPQCKNVEALS